MPDADDILAGEGLDLLHYNNNGPIDILRVFSKVSLVVPPFPSPFFETENFQSNRNKFINGGRANLNEGRPKQQRTDSHKKSFDKKCSIKHKPKRPKSLSLKFAQLFKLYLSTFVFAIVPFDSISWVRWALVNGKCIGLHIIDLITREPNFQKIEIFQKITRKFISNLSNSVLDETYT